MLRAGAVGWGAVAGGGDIGATRRDLLRAVALAAQQATELDRPRREAMLHKMKPRARKLIRRRPYLRNNMQGRT